MPKKSNTYWERRKAQNMFDYMADAEQTANEISALYLKASRHISAELDAIFERYRKKHHLSEAEAYRLLNQIHDKTSINELKEALRADKTDQAKADILAELESPAYQARLERLQQTQNQLDLTMQNVYQQEKIKNTSHYVDLANQAYYKSIFDIQQRTGLGFSFNVVDAKAIDRVINSKWSGENYSKRIWRNTQALAQDLKEELLINLVTGRTDREAAEIIQNKFASGASEARRLVRTESNNLANQMEMKSYEECDIEWYLYVATLDLRTSFKCRELDGKRFKVSEQQPGKNCPPMHPWCRSTTICDITEEELAGMERRARDPVTGKTEKVPATMSYDEWYKKHVANNPAAQVEEKKIQNAGKDKKQYETYKDTLGEEYVPKDFHKFQDEKHNKTDEYGIIKAQVKGMTYYNKAVENEPEITKHVKDVAKQTGMNMEGLDYRLKTKESYLGKIKREYSPEGNTYEVKDIIRYTYTATAKDLVPKAEKAIELHKDAGYNTDRIKNSWLDSHNPYNGVNTILSSPNGQKFEIQYHTPESYAVKDQMHKDYESWRKLDPASKEAIELRKKMFTQSQGMEVPADIERVK
ncbi:MAG: minor capsid protein [Clostridiales bacterium]|nr:minor capsid protein [Clostridiales bacterium]MDU3244392.1 minor capsid protein [Clostridiales bacterium]